jgi:hypothetical protein
MPGKMKLMLIALGVCVIAMAIGIALHSGKKGMPREIQRVLREARQFELLSLHPYRRAVEDVGDDADHFHGWRVLGKTVIDDFSAREKLIAVLNRAVKNSEGFAAECFDPRHGIRAIQDGGTAELLICFECGRMHAYLDGRRLPLEYMSSAEQPVFDNMLRRANIALAPGRRSSAESSSKLKIDVP